MHGPPPANGRRTARFQPAPTTRWSITQRGGAIPGHSRCHAARLSEPFAAAGFRAGRRPGHPAGTTDLCARPERSRWAGIVLYRPGAVGRSGWQRCPRRAGAHGGGASGTYTGWNPRAHGYGHGMQWRFEGSYIPFAETPSERAATADPRPSILERYATRQAYRSAIVAAAQELKAQGLDVGRRRRAVRGNGGRLGPPAAFREPVTTGQATPWNFFRFS